MYRAYYQIIHDLKSSQRVYKYAEFLKKIQNS